MRKLKSGKKDQDENIYIEVYSQQIHSHVKVTLLRGKTNLTGCRSPKFWFIVIMAILEMTQYFFLYKHTLIANYMNAMRQNVLLEFGVQYL